MRERHGNCAACGGNGDRQTWADRHKYRYFVVVYKEVWPLVDDEIEEAHGPLPNDQYVPAGLKYEVARNPIGRPHSERVRHRGSKPTEFLTSCGRFTADWEYARTFASDREADRTVERLASGLPVFITRAAAITAAVGLVVPACISAVAMIL